MDVQIDPSWKTHLSDEFAKPYFVALAQFVREAYQTETVYPAPGSIFQAFALCPFSAVRVVILGQDPYHGTGQANGLSFAVREGMRVPPSLQNVFKEIESDTGIHPDATNGDLSRWAKQGVLLLNATLTVQAHNAGSHQGKGWEEFTDAVVEVLNREREHLVFMLWGNYAKTKGANIDRKRHLVLEAAHPSPFAAHKGFFGTRHFSQANTYLEQHGTEPIDWR